MLHWCVLTSVPELLRCSAAGVVDVCLIPEVRFALDGDQGLFAYLETLLEQKGHLVICMAEGAGQVRRLPQRNCKGPGPIWESNQGSQQLHVCWHAIPHAAPARWLSLVGGQPTIAQPANGKLWCCWLCRCQS